MTVRKSPPRVVELDLEATAELPIIDFDDVQTLSTEALSETAVATDVYPVPVVPAGVADLAESLREVERRLGRKIERVSQLEAGLAATQHQLDDVRGQLAEAQRTSAEREAALRGQVASAVQSHTDLESRTTGLTADLAAARAQLQLQHSVLTDSQQQAEQRSRLQQDQQHELAELRRRCERLHEALSTWQGFRAHSDAALAESLAGQDEVDARHAAELQAARGESDQLRAELAAALHAATTEVASLTRRLQDADQLQQAGAEQLRAAGERAEGLMAELVASRDEGMQTQQQLEVLRAIEEKARLGAEQYDEQQGQITALQSELETAAERQRATDAQLRKADARVQRLQSDAHASAAVLGNLQQNIQRLGRDDTASRVAPQLASGTNVLRVFIRQEGGSEVVYPLGRRTSIGRTPENDIQVDASWISRHHAVLLSNPDHCIVEDLNSTNGVLVNGRRVGRQILHDGDMVTVGKTEFRYQQRS